MFSRESNVLPDVKQIWLEPLGMSGVCGCSDKKMGYDTALFMIFQLKMSREGNLRKERKVPEHLQSERSSSVNFVSSHFTKASFFFLSFGLEAWLPSDMSVRPVCPACSFSFRFLCRLTYVCVAKCDCFSFVIKYRSMFYAGG